MKVSAYLWRNRHGTWYFRAVIPQHLRHHFLQRREIRRSLQTDSRAFALRVARAARVEFDGLLDHLETTMNKKKKQVKAGLITIADLSYGNIQLKDVHIDHGDAEKEQQTLNRIISTLPSTTPQRSAAGSKLDGPLLSQVIDEFCAERVRGGNWKIKTDEEYRNGFKLLQEIISDIPVTDISRETMRAYKKLFHFSHLICGRNPSIVTKTSRRSSPCLASHR